MAKDPLGPPSKLDRWTAEMNRRDEKRWAEERKALFGEPVDYMALAREAMSAKDGSCKSMTAKATEARLKRQTDAAKLLRKQIVDALDASGWSLSEPRLTKLLIDKFGAPKDAKKYDALRNRINRILKILESENWTPRRRVQKRRQGPNKSR
jgi:hypothetical protein